MRASESEERRLRIENRGWTAWLRRAVRIAPVRRRLFTIVSAISLVLCFATVGLWVRSYWRHDSVTNVRLVQGARASFGASSFPGTLELSAGRLRAQTLPPGAAPLGWSIRSHGYPDAPSLQQLAQLLTTDPNLSSREVAGFGFLKYRQSNPRLPLIEIQRISIPHWSLAIVFAIGPTFWFFGPHRRRAKRAKLGLCRTCGYDLRASRDRCPECGAEKVSISN